MAAITAIEAIAGVSAFAPEHAPGDFDPDTGYRIARYRAPVPEAVPGARRIYFEDVQRLAKESGTVLIDVMTGDGARPDPATGEWRVLKPRENIPGSHWLPDVGKGVLSAGLENYFRTNLGRLTAGDTGRAIVIYCTADCWMGWNAAKRAASWGYTGVHWYPEGTDGWRDWDGTLAPAARAIPMEIGDVARCVPQRMPERN